MSSGGKIDQIAAEFGVHFVDYKTKPRGRHESRARRVCQNLLKREGPEHLRQIFGLINTAKNRGNWTGPCFTAVSRLLLNKEDLIRRIDFVDLFDSLDLGELLDRAKRVNPSAPTVTMSVLLAYEIDRRVEKQERVEAA
ncbi:MAG: hypothetical protein JJ866_10125 [Roseibium sp.]|uniref:hypothetical protein n=1 Tax=Roseibium sp. TaxID=1936156 RepID=UPI001B2A627B|nr:hypothetical protein [Roseibium sp.]MBO6511720.1 hypothetical protein [Roseibium sp.]MBO6892284.1 hypothetical protein [Roseibium sp.]MBO6929891.1 hypothetical protein [Roseibium sp.]